MTQVLNYMHLIYEFKLNVLTNWCDLVQGNRDIEMVLFIKFECSPCTKYWDINVKGMITLRIDHAVVSDHVLVICNEPLCYGTHQAEWWPSNLHKPTM